MLVLVRTEQLRGEKGGNGVLKTAREATCKEYWMKLISEREDWNLSEY